MKRTFANMSAISILLVEDNPGDVRLTLEAFKDAKLLLEIAVVNDGVDAIDFLYHRGVYAESKPPDLMLLDLNLPRKNGRDVLAEIKASSTLRTIPVVILTTSASDADVESSYLLHANCYISKPVDLQGFLTVVNSIENFWFSVVMLPSGDMG
jgi:chemotaxis family two-component system response regulator Rcp1